jgi:hypothetical protein
VTICKDFPMWYIVLLPWTGLENLRVLCLTHQKFKFPLLAVIPHWIRQSLWLDVPIWQIEPLIQPELVLCFILDSCQEAVFTHFTLPFLFLSCSLVVECRWEILALEVNWTFTSLQNSPIKAKIDLRASVWSLGSKSTNFHHATSNFRKKPAPMGGPTWHPSY